MANVVIEMCMDRRLVELGKLLADVEAPLEQKIGRLNGLVREGTETHARLLDLVTSLDSSDEIRVISNAGANIAGHARTLASLGEIDRLVVLAHTDSADVTKGCGAMGALSQRIEQGNRDEVFEHLGGSRYEEGYTNRAGIESLNPKIQEESAKKYVSKPEVMLVDTSHLILPVDNGVHITVVADAGVGKAYISNLRGTERFETYMIVGKPEDVRIDIKVAESLGMHEIRNLQKRKAVSG